LCGNIGRGWLSRRTFIRIKREYYGSEKKNDYSAITESPGIRATREQVQRLYQRYRFARDFAHSKDVMEVACGSGLGLGYLASVAKSVAGIDIDEKNIALAREHYCLPLIANRSPQTANRKPLNVRRPIHVALMDAHKLEFPNGASDLVILFEAIYYLFSPEKFTAEAARVLREDGTLIIGMVNKDWKDFHPSPYTHKYFSIPELKSLLEPHFKDIMFYAGFPAGKKGLKDNVISLIKRAALKVNLIPGSLEARAYLKRIFIGKLVPLPDEITEGMAPYEEPVEISCNRPCRDYKITYAVATKK